MSMFTKQLTLKCSNGGEAMKKLKKLMKRGCTDDFFNTNFNNLSEWNLRKAAAYSDSPCNLIVHNCGRVLIVGHTGAGNMINRVRDVENYRV